MHVYVFPYQEKGLVTYFEETWVAERDQRRHSIEREIEINESDLYKSSRPPPLFYGDIYISFIHAYIMITCCWLTSCCMKNITA